MRAQEWSIEVGWGGLAWLQEHRVREKAESMALLYVNNSLEYKITLIKKIACSEWFTHVTGKKKKCLMEK